MQPVYPLPYEATFAHRVVSTDGQDTLDIWERTPRGSAQAWDDFPPEMQQALVQSLAELPPEEAARIREGVNRERPDTFPEEGDVYSGGKGGPDDGSARQADRTEEGDPERHASDR